MTAACNHQWSTWKFQPRSSAETRWCHACNTTEDQPRARNYQELPAILMGELVAPRKSFIQTYARSVRQLDV